jgi:hypothetical protein
MNQTVEQDNSYCDWGIDVAGPAYESKFTGTYPSPHISLYAASDPYYSLDFDSRAQMVGFIQQLQALADEVWPQ